MLDNLRLINSVGNVSNDDGRLEVFRNGEWETVCDDGFGSTEAAVVCRQLGGRYIRLFYSIYIYMIFESILSNVLKTV